LWARVLGKVFDLGVAIHIVHLAQYTIAVTRSEERFYRTNSVKIVRTIYEPVTMKERPNIETLNDFRRRFGIDEKELIVLIVGRIEKRKGLDILVKALPTILGEIPDTRVLIVGEDWGALQGCLKLARSSGCLDRLTVTGALGEQDLSTAYALCDVVVIPSYFEAYGRTLVEAWSFCKPPVISDGVALGELVTPHTGLVVERGSPIALAQATIRVLRDREWALKLGRSGKAVVDSTIPDSRTVVNTLVQVYHEVVPA